MKKLFIILLVYVSFFSTYAQNGVNDSVCDVISNEMVDGLCDTIDVNNCGITQKAEATTILDLEAVNTIGKSIDSLFIANDESIQEDEIPESTEDDENWLICILGIMACFMVMSMSRDCPL